MHEKTLAMRQALENWRTENRINKAELNSLAYVAEATVNRVINGKNYIPTQHRIYLVTGLPEFKLDQAQQEKYNKCIAWAKEEYWEEKICKYFIEKWKTTGKLPELEYRLYISSSNSQNRAELTEKIKKELLTEVPMPTKAPEKNTVQVVQDVVTMEVLNNELMQMITTGTEAEISEFAKANKKSMQKLYSNLVVLLDPKPFNAATNIRELKKNF